MLRANSSMVRLGLLGTEIPDFVVGPVLLKVRTTAKCDDDGANCAKALRAIVVASVRIFPTRVVDKTEKVK